MAGGDGEQEISRQMGHVRDSTRYLTGRLRSLKTHSKDLIEDICEVTGLNEAFFVLSKELDDEMERQAGEENDAQLRSGITQRQEEVRGCCDEIVEETAALFEAAGTFAQVPPSSSEAQGQAAERATPRVPIPAGGAAALAVVEDEEMPEKLRDIKRALECVICKTVNGSSVRVFQCEEGHLICANCHSQHTECPLRCGNAYRTRPPIRCRLAELIFDILSRGPIPLSP